MTTRRPMPTQEDVLGYFDALSNWGRWGEDDGFGTLTTSPTTSGWRRRGPCATAGACRADGRSPYRGRWSGRRRRARAPRTCRVRRAPCRCRLPQRPSLGLLVRAARHLRSTATRSPTSTRRATSSGTARCTTDVRTRWSTPRRGRRGPAVTAAANGIITRGVLLDIAGPAMCHAWNRGRVCIPTTWRRPSITRVSGSDPAMRCSCGPAMVRVRHEAGEVAACAGRLARFLPAVAA